MGETDLTQLEERLRAELTLALRARDRAVVSAMRSALARLANAQAVPPPAPAPEGAVVDSVHVAGAIGGLGATETARRELTPAERSALVTAERAELVAHAQRLRDLCRWDEADGVQRAAEALGRVLASGP